MRIATWNIGEDESKKDGKLDISSYTSIINVLKIGSSLTYKSKKVLKDFSDHNICIVNI